MSEILFTKKNLWRRIYKEISEIAGKFKVD